jgi:tetratricopeptide (TPR) repeat protein
MDTADRPYPRRAADLEKLSVLLEAWPGYLERRMKLLEAQLTGRDRIVLSTSPTALAEKLRAIKHVGEIKLWPLPYEVLEQRHTLTPEMQRAAAMERMPFSIPADPEEDAKHPQVDDAQRRRHPVYALRLARLLQLRGLFGKTDALRPANQHGADLSAVAQRGATAYYLLALPSSDQLNELIRDQQDKIEIARGRFLSKEFVDAFQQKRDDAAFWLGVILFEQGDFQTAAQNFGPMTLDAYPTGPWTNAARFLLARCYETEGKTAEAIKLYEADKSPQRYGNRLRAERLKAQQGASAEKKSAP